MLEKIIKIFKGKTEVKSPYLISEEVLAAALKQKRDAAVAYLGTKWLLHPDNHVKSKKAN